MPGSGWRIQRTVSLSPSFSFELFSVAATIESAIWMVRPMGSLLPDHHSTFRSAIAASAIFQFFGYGTTRCRPTLLGNPTWRRDSADHESRQLIRLQHSFTAPSYRWRCRPDLRVAATRQGSWPAQEGIMTNGKVF
jgi:hypothetical protein